MPNYLSKLKLNGVEYSLRASGGSSSGANTFIGTCATAALTKDKEATVDNSFSLEEGVRVGIKFSHTNDYSSETSNPITLNVNSSGAKNIWYDTTHSGAGNTGKNTKAYGVAGRYNFYIYDGTYWVWDGCGIDDNTTYTNISADAIKTGSDTTSRTVRADYLNTAINDMIDAKVGTALSASY